eukprot:14617826-Alexandrium_andersonii.AAC.1
MGGLSGVVVRRRGPPYRPPALSEGRPRPTRPTGPFGTTKESLRYGSRSCNTMRYAQGASVALELVGCLARVALLHPHTTSSE